jgi:tetratricopeptide (TPR) repeat protein
MPNTETSSRTIDIASVIDAIRDGKHQAALDMCAPLLTETSEDPVLNALAARAAQALGRHAEARAFLERSLSVRANHARTLVLFGQVCSNLGDDACALTAFDRAFYLEPRLAGAAFPLCAALLQTGDPRAQEILRHLLLRFPNEVEGWEQIGNTLLKLNKVEAALVCFQRANQSEPSFARSMREGLLLRELGRSLDAIAAFEKAVSLDPDSSRGWFLLGVSFQDSKEMRRATQAYRRALAIDPMLAEAAVNLGTSLQEAGDLEAAMIAYAQAVKIRPDTFGRIAQAMTTSQKGELWLDLSALRQSLAK